VSSILLVCTGNLCRSPLAEAFLRRALVERFGRQAPTVSSAGTMAVAEVAPTREAITVAAEHGLDIGGHAARLLEPPLLRDADLILGMGPDHLERIRAADPAAGARAFTLKELVGVLEHLPPPAVGRGPSSLVDRVAAADDHRLREGADHPHDEDVVDPIGHPVETYRATASELAALCDRLVDGLFGPREEEALEEDRAAKA
jgi:protein-tyrosine phosphatase